MRTCCRGAYIEARVKLRNLSVKHRSKYCSTRFAIAVIFDNDTFCQRIFRQLLEGILIKYPLYDCLANRLNNKVQVRARQGQSLGSNVHSTLHTSPNFDFQGICNSTCNTQNGNTSEVHEGRTSADSKVRKSWQTSQMSKVQAGLWNCDFLQVSL